MCDLVRVGVRAGARVGVGVRADARAGARVGVGAKVRVREQCVRPFAG